MLLAQLCRCIEGALPWGEEERCFHCGHDTVRPESTVLTELMERYEHTAYERLWVAVQEKRFEMLLAGDFDQLYIDHGREPPSEVLAELNREERMEYVMEMVAG